MSALDDDLARVAALRGKPAEDYVGKAAPSPRLTRQTLLLVFQLQPATERDLAAYDALPPTSRTFIRECPLPINALVWASALEIFGEAALIDAARAEAATRLRTAT